MQLHRDDAVKDQRYWQINLVKVLHFKLELLSYKDQSRCRHLQPDGSRRNSVFPYSASIIQCAPLNLQVSMKEHLEDNLLQCTMQDLLRYDDYNNDGHLSLHEFYTAFRE